jgi:hypothetical protein
MNTPGGLSQLIGNITSTATSPTVLGQNVGVIGAITGYRAPSVASLSCSGGGCSSVPNFGLGSCSDPSHPTPATCNTVIDVVEGNLTMGGNVTGYGVLLVEGTLNMGGDVSWYGPIFVVGDGNFVYGGGGSGQIHGNLLVANIWSTATTYPNTSGLYGVNNMGSPRITWNGGGTNGIQFDHCWTTDLMNNISGTYTTNIPYKVLSFRVLPY